MIQRQSRQYTFAAIFMGILISGIAAPGLSAEKAADSAAEAERQKALKNPYPNDFGPDKIDAGKYSAEARQGYELMQVKCSRCHSPSRVLNSQFVDVKPEELPNLKKTDPAIFKDPLVWQVEPKIWQRYVKRMMSKPGCELATEDGKKIWKFVVEDSLKRKTGAAAAAWKEHRRKLLDDFKEKHPKQYQELFEPKP